MDLKNFGQLLADNYPMRMAYLRAKQAAKREGKNKQDQREAGMRAAFLAERFTRLVSPSRQQLENQKCGSFSHGEAELRLWADFR
ncbi:hypothetical protein A3H53_03605 [Candidatus Nomurabacteria bacterium RIFCSPLOWO2_02_FULL_40_10]|uniref:Uncharacterized protein n=2 Tax=Candidatus Nomuraibacteriota TaxID=1752729 RepID=A0A1F6XVR3_9BACT|nr:MAG: hypothetical protein A2642_02465 [Candidatus Nomurabacteria bacterium RIFCSPHIGHO2_01_FULL_39_10]OGI98204.1 MAG: hypothetical protein A3H53_03605 [Candidatus Nomurabacteria bacterium RIFCSPLOWO2_02_FULL_40_10]